MNVSRRFFIGELAGCAVVGPRRIFAAAPGAFTSGVPELAFGVLSDVHICLEKGGKKLKKSYDTTYLEKAFAWFRDNGADAVVIAGDQRTHASAKCRIAMDRLPSGEVTFEVRAYSCWDKASEPLVGKFKQEEKAC